MNADKFIIQRIHKINETALINSLSNSFLSLGRLITRPISGLGSIFPNRRIITCMF